MPALPPPATQHAAKVEPLRVCVTGAAGQIAYSLIINIANGTVFGPEQPVILQLLDIAPALEAMKGVEMELYDCALPLLSGIVLTTDPLEAFRDVDYAILLGAMPRRAGMLRKDLLKANVGIFQVQGAAIDAVAKKTVKVVVVGNPANTNALVCSHYAPSIPKANFSALTRLDENRAKSMVAVRAGVAVDQVKNVIIWGNHSNTQYPDVAHAHIAKDGARVAVEEAIKDEAYLHGEFIKAVALRGAAIIAARKLSSAMSAAKAVVDHVRDWHFGTRSGEFVSMAVVTDAHAAAAYGIPEDLCFSLPLSIKDDGHYEVVAGLPVSDFARGKLDATVAELEEEKAEAFAHIEYLAAVKKAEEEAKAAHANGEAAPVAKVSA
ncbi:Malate dehydrogenase, cytoplasmic [Allomyces javanicus]|nr:Malate dehydrogenase, cytoplasmic [Allomyces javanicus]